jgi:hypothetical protein
MDRAGSCKCLRAGRGEAEKGSLMVKNLDDLQQVGKDNMDIALKSLGAASKSGQAIAVEVADYAKRSFEQGSSALEKLVGAKSVEKAIEVQTEYARSAYQGFISESAKLGELYTDLAKEAYKPFETYFGKLTPAR